MLQPNLGQGERLLECLRLCTGQVAVACEELAAEWHAVPELLSSGIMS